MNLIDLTRWQWQGYPDYHQSRANLLLHLFAVPLFLLGNVGLVLRLLQQAWPQAGLCLLAMVVSIVLQGRGHGRETHPPVPFSSASNAVARILLEQWVNFPRFVLSGGWLRALRQS